jgi:hypothetical protein
VSVVSATEAGELPPAGFWSVESIESTPQSLRQSATDSRFASWLVTASVDGVTVGLLPLYRPKGPSFSSPIFDPASVAPEVFGGRGRRADEYLLIGGHLELFAGAATAAGLDDTSAREVVAAMVDAAYGRARAESLVPAALYVRDKQLDGFAGTGARRPAAIVGQFASLAVAGATDEEYLACLNHGRRSVVRRDWRKLDALGLRAVVVPARDIVAEAAPLVAAVKQRHGVLDHPRLVEHRLTLWANRLPAPRLAFVVRDAAGDLLAVSFGAHRPGVLELYEIGLADDPEVRGLAYAEVLVYAPLREAGRAGCVSVSLGMDSPTPKVLRGAQLTPVWAVGGL